MSSRERGDFGNDLLAAKERDLKPLLEESGEVLDLDPAQTEVIEDFLTLAWVSGSRSGHDQMEARATQADPDIAALATSRLESEFKPLMEESADRLNLTLRRTIDMWGLLQRAWMVGNRTCEAEIRALLIENKSDVTEEALKWLENGGDATPENYG